MEQTKYDELIKQFHLNAKDTGSSAVQIINLTKEVIELTEHLKSQKKDITAKRSLLKKVATRRRFLKYLQSKDQKKYEKLLLALNLKG